MSRPTTTNGSAARIAGLTIVNAMVFQEVLADYETPVRHIRQVLQSPDSISAFADHWDFILTQINYYPIFHVAHQLLIALPSNPDSEGAVRSLAKTALHVVQQRTAMRHDLMGRVYHRLLAQAKYLGTFYTSVPAATLLLKLALQPDQWSLDWSDLGQLSFFTVGDLACGTGTLLMAAAEAITDNYLRSCGERRRKPQMEILSRLLMEDIIHGYDVLPSALHLTASTLALRSPDVTFRLMQLWTLPLGGPHRRLGSIEFFKDSVIPVTTDLFRASEAPGQVTAKGDLKQLFASLPRLDLCIMNPPFTRSVGGNLLFGSLPDEERRPMQEELTRLLRRPAPPIHASSTAGLGSVFVALGDSYLKPGGRMALVLPKALLSGVAWHETRRLFRLGYHLEYVIASHDPARWNFSDNTDLSEVLVIARKLEGAEKPRDADSDNVVCINLWKNPSNSVEALGVAHLVKRDAPPNLEKAQGAVEIMIGDAKFGEAVSAPWATIKEGSWMPPCAFAQADLLRAAHYLTRGQLFLPGYGVVGDIPLCPLGQMGTLGPDARDIHDGFKLATGRTSYAAFWSHDASSVITLAQMANKYLTPLHKAKTGRPLRQATVLWPRAGKIMVAERLRFNTQRLVAVHLDDKALSNTWWPFAPIGQGDETPKGLTLWLNSTLGLLSLLTHREETQGAWMKFKKPVLTAMPVLDINGMNSSPKQALVEAYDRLCQQPLMPFPEMEHDPTRAAMDAAIAGALGLPDLSPLRLLLSQEPVVCLKPLY